MEGKDEYLFLKRENERLLKENQKLRIENAELKDQIQKYEARLVDSGISEFPNAGISTGSELFRASENSEMIEAPSQRDIATDTLGQEAVYVHASQIQVSLDQLLPLSEGTPQRNIDKSSSTPEKLELFRSLFCGRTDVYAKRYYSMKSGKSGYAPVCANAGTPHLCDKKKYSCGECPNRELLPLSDKVICNHIIGKDEFARDVIGIYPIFPDNTVRFLAIDLDEENWRTDLNAILTGCKRAGIFPSVERSRSGQGAHIWVFSRIEFQRKQQEDSGMDSLRLQWRSIIHLSSLLMIGCFQIRMYLPKAVSGI